MSKNFFRRNWKVILNVFTLVLLAVTIYFLRHDIGKTFADLGRVNAVFLILLPFWQIINYSAYAHMYATTLEILKAKVPMRELYKTSLELNFVNHVLPSGGVSGFSYFALRLREYGVSGAQATLVQSMRFALTFGSFIILLFAGLFMLALGGSASNMMILITCSLAFLTLFSVLAGMYIVSNKRRIHKFTQGATKFVNKIVHMVRPKSPEVIKLHKVAEVFDDLHHNYLLLKENKQALKRPLFYALLANVTELITLYTVYLAYGQAVNPGAVIIAYAVANFAGLVAVLPGGVGVYEGLMTLIMVTAGVPAGLSLSVTVMYRVLTILMSIPVGYYLYNQALKRLGNKQVEKAMVEDVENTPLDDVAEVGEAAKEHRAKTKKKK